MYHLALFISPELPLSSACGVIAKIKSAVFISFHFRTIQSLRGNYKGFEKNGEDDIKIL